MHRALQETVYDIAPDLYGKHAGSGAEIILEPFPGLASAPQNSSDMMMI